MLKKLALPMTLAGICATHSGSAQADDARWATTIWAGPLFTGHDTAQFGTSGGLADLGSLDPAFSEDSATTSIKGLSFHDMFRTGETLGAEFAYRASDAFEPFARVSFSRLGGRATTIGTLDSEAFTAATDIRANFDSQQSSALTLGARYLFAASGSLHPFVSGYVGADHMDALRANVTVPLLTQRFDRETVLPNNTRFIAGAQAGLSYDIGSNADLRFSIGAERLSAQELESKFLTPLGIDAIKVSEQRWVLPAEIGINYRF